MKQILLSIAVVLVSLIGFLCYHRIVNVVDDAPSTNSNIPSIGVLPFVNLTNDSTLNYFSDGITEAILNSLAQLKAMKVSSRHPSFKYQGQNVDIKQVGKELSVQTLLEGSYQQRGEHIRITAHLINVADGLLLWSGWFDEKSGNFSFRE